jgi:hypothetical protein
MLRAEFRGTNRYVALRTARRGPLFWLCSARTCLGISELRIGAVVPARKKAVELTATSIGVSSLLGRMVLQSVAQIKPDKINYGWGLVKLKGGRKCVQPPTRDEDTSTR